MAVSRTTEAGVRCLRRAPRREGAAHADRAGTDLQAVTLLRRNLIANFAGSGWSALVSLAVLPACLRLMGVEAYGLVGIFATLLSLLLPFEAGLRSALSRDLAGGARPAHGETDAPVLPT